MAPPTGASDSILVVGRNGASLESRHGAFAPRVKDQSMDPNENKLRKSLGEKWKISRAAKSPLDSQMIEASNFMVHPDYLTKYGTLSNGVLTKSIKYAETWLYGTVGVRGAPTQRPSLFLYPGVVAPSPRRVSRNGYLASHGSYLGVPHYPSSERNGFGASQPRVHTVNQNDLQPYRCGDCGKDVHSGPRSLCKKCGEKRSGTCRRSRSTPKGARETRVSAAFPSDPYDLMRKSRLGVGETTEPSSFALERSRSKKRTASASPARRPAPTSPSFETFKPKETNPWRSSEEGWTNGEEEVVRRKSILECDVNAYELNKSKEVDADELSDEFGSGISKGNPKLKILRPKLNKTDLRSSKPETGRSTEEVRLNGQRFKIFDRSNPSTSVVEGYVSDDEDCKKAKESLIPRLPSPKRPPRRPKDKILGEMGFKYSKSKSKSSPNLSIKSILKKPCGGDDASVLDLSATESEEPANDAESDKAAQQSPSSKKQNQSTLKKKKQVQFRVHVSNESLSREGGAQTEETDECDVSHESVQRSKSCENLPSVGQSVKESETGSEAKCEDFERDRRKELSGIRQPLSQTQDEPLCQVTQLKRSYSDRRPSSALVLYKEDVFSLSVSPPNAYLFNDTMALRTRATRQDTIGLFVSDADCSSGKINNKLDIRKEVPVQELMFPGNFISYEEFSKRTDSAPPEKQNLILKSKLPVSSSATPRKKSPAPSPPPRQMATKSIKTKNGAVSVTVSSDKVEASTPKAPLPKVNSEEVEDGKTFVKLTPEEPAPSESTNVEGKRASITIHPKNLASDETTTQCRRKTSVMKNAFDPQDCNKVTISVRNEEEPNASTCTIIETGSNSTVIPVMSTDNKTTLIVGSTTQPSPTVDELPNPYIFSKVGSEVDFMDPVEAVKRNLIPHICGKEDSGGTTLMEKIKQSRDAKEQKNQRQISQFFGQVDEPPIICHSSQFLFSSCKNKKGTWKIKSEDSSSTASRSNSFCSTVNSSTKNSSSNTSRSSSFRSSCYKSTDGDYDSSLSKFCLFSDAEDASGQERDKLEYEYEIRNGFKDERKEDEENIYETIKEEPIYDQIRAKSGNEESEDEIPPPLPLTLPPSLDEVDKRSAKSIFEGASKYDILNYLVDAKERVQEESYYSGSSASDDADGRREKSDASLDAGPSTDDGRAKCEDVSLPETDSGYDLSSRMSNLSQTSYSSDDNLTPGAADREILKLSRKSSAEIERNDSGVGSETSHTSRSKWQTGLSIREDPQHLCEDCDQAVETQVTGSGVMYAPMVCRKCSKRRSERKEIIQEIVETEEKYGRDLKIILEEFYKPMLVAGLLNPDQLSAIFLNTEELLENSEQLTEKLRDTLEIAMENGDEDLLTVNIGKLFLDAGPMLHAFESYCTRQGAAAVLLANLEKDKELLRIFLRVSQMENAVLRRMNLNSFLMVRRPNGSSRGSSRGQRLSREADFIIGSAFISRPRQTHSVTERIYRGCVVVCQAQIVNIVWRYKRNSNEAVPVQRVTKYPLLLARLHKVTPPQQEGRALLKEAQHNIELHLEHMNSEAKDVSATKVWRRFSTSTGAVRKSTSEVEMINIKLRKMALDVLEWNHEEVRFVLEGKLLYTQPTDSNWKRGRTIKLTPVFVLLVTLGKPNSKYKMEPPDDELTFPSKTGVREATLLLVKEKCGRYTLIREPLYLDKIIVCCETDVDEFFEIQELSTKDSYIFKAEDAERTKEWYRYLQYHAQILGSWRRRRNALANIMINGMMARACTS